MWWLLRGWRGHTEQWSRAIPSPSRPPRRGGGCTGQHNAYIPMPYAAHTTASPNTTVHYTPSYTFSGQPKSTLFKTKQFLASSIQIFVLRKWPSDKIQDHYSNSHNINTQFLSMNAEIISMLGCILGIGRICGGSG